MSLNLKRRHLDASQLAFVALEIEKFEAVRAKERQLAAQNNLAGRAVKVLIPEQDEGQARDKAAIAVGVSPRYVSDAKSIEATFPVLAEQVKAGEKTITQAKREIKELKREERREENKRKLAQVPLSQRIDTLDAKFATIVIDPPCGKMVVRERDGQPVRASDVAAAVARYKNQRVKP